MILTRAEVAELTGYVRFRAQVRALEKMGIPHLVRSNGSPAVMRASLETPHLEEQHPTASEWGDECVVRLPPMWFANNWQHLIVPRFRIVRDAIPWRGVRSHAGHAIYALVLGEQITYVGRSNQTPMRLWKHQETGKRFDRAWVLLEFPDVHVAELESLYINGLMPPDNGAIPPCADRDRERAAALFGATA